MKKIIYDIKKYTLKDYDAIVREFIEFFSNKYGDSISLYQFGNTNHPSVSDLDLAIILEETKLDNDTISSIVRDAEEFIVVNDSRKYIFVHEILVYSYTAFQYSEYFQSISNLKHLYGKAVEGKVNTNDLSYIRDIQFIGYGTAVVKDFELLHKQKDVNLRTLLKSYQQASNLFNFLVTHYRDHYPGTESIKMLISRIKQLRMEAIQKKINPSLQGELIHFFYEIFNALRSVYRTHMRYLSEKIVGKKLEKELLVLENKRFSRRHELFIYMGALYGQIYEKKKNCYADIHRKKFPLDISQINFNENHKKVIERQAELLLQSSDIYAKHGIIIAGPLMCYSCEPNIDLLQQATFVLQKQLYKLLGYKVLSS